MRTSLSLPTPVVMAYDNWLLATSSSTTARARSTASLASDASRTGRLSTATSWTFSSVRSFPLIWRACIEAAVGYWLLALGVSCRLRANNRELRFCRLFRVNHITKDSHVFLRNRRLLHFAIDHHVHGLAFGEQQSVCRPHELIPEMHHGLTCILELRANDNLIVVSR